jgi:hypothetical protein
MAEGIGAARARFNEESGSPSARLLRERQRGAET